MRPSSERVLLDGHTARFARLDYRIDYDLGRIDFMRPDTLFREAANRRSAVRGESRLRADADDARRLRLELPVSHGVLELHGDQPIAAARRQRARSSDFKRRRVSPRA